MIHVCFSLFDKNGNYSKYAGVAMRSLLDNATAPVQIHLLHDATLTKANRERFSGLVEGGDHRIAFYQIEMPKHLPALKTLRNLTIGTLFRLKIPETLPREVDRLIYLDTDVVVHRDIAELWKTEMNDALLMAVHDQGFVPATGKRLFETGVLSEEAYFNAGVMLWNLKEIRERYDLLTQALDFLTRYPESPFLDQEALNYLFLGKTGYLPVSYNYFTLFHRGENEPERPYIYHFAGDHPHAIPVDVWDKLFFAYLMKTPWADAEEMRRYYTTQMEIRDRRAEVLRTIVRNSRGKKRAIFGAAGMLGERIAAWLSLDAAADYCVDNNARLHETTAYGLPVYAPEKIKEEARGDVYVFVISNLYYPEIKAQLESFGLKEKQDFIDARWILSESENGHYVL